MSPASVATGQVHAVQGQRTAAMIAMAVARRNATLKAISTASAAAMIRLSMAMRFIPRAWYTAEANAVASPPSVIFSR